MKKLLYLIASAKSRRIVGWSLQQPTRDAMLTDLNHSFGNQYIAGEVVIDGVNTRFTPEDLQCPECYRAEFRRKCEELTDEVVGR